jgi:hypothetical protein
MLSSHYILVVLASFVSLGWCYSTMKPDSSIQTAEVTAARLIKNMDNNPQLPLNFRLMTDEPLEEETAKKAIKPSYLGLQEIKASGSAQFSELSLYEIIRNIPDSYQLIVIDLRQESHGFTDGTAVSWYGNNNWFNRHKEPSVIEREQTQLLGDIVQQKYISIYSDKYATDPDLLSVAQTQSEAELVKRLGVDYKRFYVTDHVKPSDSTVDDFITFIQHLPSNSWLHFHCAKGRGRTTTFLTMYDILHNSHRVSFEDIIARQQQIGGADLEKMSPGTYKERDAEERYAFLQHFYDYCRANPHLEQTWSSWLQQQ